MHDRCTSRLIDIEDELGQVLADSASVFAGAATVTPPKMSLKRTVSGVKPRRASRQPLCDFEGASSVAQSLDAELLALAGRAAQQDGHRNAKQAMQEDDFLQKLLVHRVPL